MLDGSFSDTFSVNCRAPQMVDRSKLKTLKAFPSPKLEHEPVLIKIQNSGLWPAPYRPSALPPYRPTVLPSYRSTALS
ncbi:hypothetical protein EVAR_20123_1 [Eumeta japonica]|uniref:Uncharacterized protein n=1 Tax=Eumeta variegata TaxID=151549 RepID=A0A4C1V4L3_EUMVA|nr:hypothetical protein EVAR_20123_1 [Eumeta japonica]